MRYFQEGFSCPRLNGHQSGLSLLHRDAFIFCLFEIQIGIQSDNVVHSRFNCEV